MRGSADVARVVALALPPGRTAPFGIVRGTKCLPISLRLGERAPTAAG